MGFRYESRANFEFLTEILLQGKNLERLKNVRHFAHFVVKMAHDQF